MARLRSIKDQFLVSQIAQMYQTNLSPTSMHKKEKQGLIPKADRQNRYRVWKTRDLPLIGEALGYLDKPEKCIVISVFSLKGGTAKTTTAFQLARTLALHNIRTLAVGLDAQRSLTQILSRGLNEDVSDAKGLYHVLAKNHKMDTVIRKTDLETLDYIPETIELSVLDIYLRSQPLKEHVIKDRVFDQLRENYDIIICDCNPSWSDTVAAALAGTDILISPLGCDIISLKSCTIFVDILNDYQDKIKHKFKRLMILPTLLENNNVSHNVLKQYREQYGKMCSVSAIRRAVLAQEANIMGRSLMETRCDSPLYEDYTSMFAELNTEIKEYFKDKKKKHRSKKQKR